MVLRVYRHRDSLMSVYRASASAPLDFTMLPRDRPDCRKILSTGWSVKTHRTRIQGNQNTSLSEQEQDVIKQVIMRAEALEVNEQERGTNKEITDTQPYGRFVALLESGRVENHLGTPHLPPSIPSSSDRDSNLDLPVLDSLAQHKTSVLANYATEADKTEKENHSKVGTKITRWKIHLVAVTDARIVTLRLWQWGNELPTEEQLVEWTYDTLEQLIEILGINVEEEEEVREPPLTNKRAFIVRDSILPDEIAEDEISLGGDQPSICPVLGRQFASLLDEEDGPSLRVRDCVYRIAQVQPLRPIVWNNATRFWILQGGVDLPRPPEAPVMFQRTKNSPKIVEVIEDWVLKGWLCPDDNERHMFPLYLIPKVNGTIRIIQDISPCTAYFETPRFSLLTAGRALQDIPTGYWLRKLDLVYGFYHMELNQESSRTIGVYFRGQKYAVTRLPMGHPLAQAILQRITTEAVRALKEVLPSTRGIAYPDDLLLYSNDADELQHVPALLETMGFSINIEKSFRRPERRSIYLGLLLDTQSRCLSLTEATHRKAITLLKHLQEANDANVLHIVWYIACFVHNLRWPGYATARIYRRCPGVAESLLALPRWARCRWGEAPAQVTTVFADATPWSLAGVNPEANAAIVQRFLVPLEINQAEVAAGLVTLQWELLER
uniref:Reverse transcriptase domain-containing protein n=1 Tax=Timema poppense TaxID=170557 RepID=A0A7R9GZT4_TIMPO|nr:unnamed protein product [Timema poppensis]